MPVFFYKARDVRGQKVTDTLEAESPEIVVEQLWQQGYCVTALNPCPLDSKLKPSLLSIKRVRLSELVIFTRQFEVLLRAGVPMNRALWVLQRQTTNRWLKAILTQVQKEVQGGNPLHLALAAHPSVFSTLYVEMVKAGEQGGILEQVLDNLARTLQKELDLRNKIRAALLYPGLLVFLALVVVVFLVTVILPGFIFTLEQMGTSIPLPTRVIMGLSRWLREFFWFLAAGTGIVGCGLIWYMQTPKGKYRRDQLLLQIPVGGKLFLRIATARFTGLWSALLACGIPVIQALEIVEGTVTNQVLKEALMRARQAIIEGGSMAYLLYSTGVLENMAVQMIAVGEESGELEKMLAQVAEYYESVVNSKVATLIPLFEPALILVVSVIVGFVVLSIFLPVLEVMYTVEF